MKKKHRKVSNVILAAAVCSVVCYTLTATAMQLFTGTELSPTLTTAWFTFWGTEIIALAAIRTCKVKHGSQENAVPDDCSDRGEDPAEEQPESDTDRP